jgi:mRNA-degrading endonuclease RelE of RelBE toxin-antitoxin system
MADDPFVGDVGSYRIFFAVDTSAKTVAISAIIRRTSKTY